MITYEQLNELVSKVKGTTFAGITTKTKVKLTGGKKNPMQDRVEKLTENSNVILFSDSDKSGYAEMVKRRMINEGKDPSTFELKPRVWGVRVGNTPFIEHNGDYYLEVIFISSGKTTYLLDGVPVDKSKIQGLPEEKETTETYKESQGGIENKVILRTYKLDSIISIKLMNEMIHA